MPPPPEMCVLSSSGCRAFVPFLLLICCILHVNTLVTTSGRRGAEKKKFTSPPPPPPPKKNPPNYWKCCGPWRPRQTFSPHTLTLLTALGLSTLLLGRCQISILSLFLEVLLLTTTDWQAHHLIPIRTESSVNSRWQLYTPAAPPRLRAQQEDEHRPSLSVILTTFLCRPPVSLSTSWLLVCVCGGGQIQC